MNTERADVTNIISTPALHLKLGPKDLGFLTPGYEAAEAGLERIRNPPPPPRPIKMFEPLEDVPR